MTVVIVGAGLAGIALGATLKRANRNDFLIVERADDVGGTWRDNIYPGVACDIPASLYDFSFRPNPHWERRFASGPQLHDYLREVVRLEGLEPHLRLGRELLDAQWNRVDRLWDVAVTGGRMSCEFLVLATGRLSEPKWPDVDGIDSFPGPVIHTARWLPDVSLDGRDVAVIGTGASAVQVLPEIVERARRTTLFMRSAPWVLPRGDHVVDEATRSAFARDPKLLGMHREALFADAERGHSSRVRRGPERESLRSAALHHLAAQIDDPSLRDRLTPRYEIGCKRVLFSDTFYPAITSADLELEPSELVCVDGRTTVGGSGRTSTVDAIVVATGFETADPPVGHRVTGRNGLRLSAHWARGMTSFGTVLVHGFPNMFVIDGPNAALGHNSATLMIEAQAELIATLLERADRHGVVLDVTSTAERRWTRDIDDIASRTVWLDGGCSSWYVDPRSDRLTLLWPGTVAEFRHALNQIARGPLPIAEGR